MIIKKVVDTSNIVFNSLIIAKKHDIRLKIHSNEHIQYSRYLLSMNINEQIVSQTADRNDHEAQNYLIITCVSI